MSTVFITDTDGAEFSVASDWWGIRGKWGPGVRGKPTAPLSEVQAKDWKPGDTIQTLLPVFAGCSVRGSLRPVRFTIKTLELREAAL